MPKYTLKRAPSRRAPSRLHEHVTGKDLAEIYERLEAECPIAALQVRLIEALNLRPHDLARR